MASTFHLRAVAKLLFTLGPQHFQTVSLLSAFESARATLIIASIISRQRLFLDRKEWLAVPWALHPAAKTPQSQLCDILVAVPGYLAEYEELKQQTAPLPGVSLSYRDSATATASRTVQRRSALLKSLESRLERLFLWRWIWQRHHGHEVSVDLKSPSPQQPNASASKILGSIGRPRRSERLVFSRASAAAEIMLYNATLMWLLALLWKVEPLLAGDVIKQCSMRAAAAAAVGLDEDDDGQQQQQQQQQSRHPTSETPRPTSTSRYVSWTSFAPLRRPGAALSVRDPAVEICRAFEWQCREGRGGSGSEEEEPNAFYLFPLGTAMSALDDDAECREWIAWMLASSRHTEGYGVQSGDCRNSNPAGFGYYLTREALHPELVSGEEEEGGISIKAVIGILPGADEDGGPDVESDDEAATGVNQHHC